MISPPKRTSGLYRRWAVTTVAITTNDISPPPQWPSVATIGAACHEIVPAEGEEREQERADSNWRNNEAPGHVVHDHHQRIDTGRRMKCARQVHHHDRQSHRERGGPWRRSA